MKSSKKFTQPCNVRSCSRSRCSTRKVFSTTHVQHFAQKKVRTTSGALSSSTYRGRKRSFVARVVLRRVDAGFHRSSHFRPPAFHCSGVPNYCRVTALGHPTRDASLVVGFPAAELLKTSNRSINVQGMKEGEGGAETREKGIKI